MARQVGPRRFFRPFVAGDYCTKNGVEEGREAKSALVGDPRPLAAASPARTYPPSVPIAPLPPSATSKASVPLARNTAGYAHASIRPAVTLGESAGRDWLGGDPQEARVNARKIAGDGYVTLALLRR